MTTHGKRRRTTPVLIGLVTALLVAAVALIVGPLSQPSDLDASADRSVASPATGDPERPNPVERIPPAPSGAPQAIPPAPLVALPPTAAPTPVPANPGVPVALPLLVPGLPPYLPALVPVVSKPVPVAPAKPLAPKTKPAPTPGLSGPAAQVVTITNAERVKAGCKPLKVDSRLNLSAQRHSADMARRNYFRHEDPEGRDFADREKAAGFVGESGGENIAMGQKTAAEVMNDWINSPGHRRNILDCSYTLIGVGYAADGNYWTQNFGG